MTTVTSLTASRMLEIEAASVVDGDIVGDNLVLTRHDGTQINAGSVRGPQGTPGLPSADLQIITAKQVLDVGLSGQIRAGRVLTAADFTNMGLSAPLGLWNLADLTDASGNGRNLVLKGAASAGTAPGILGGSNNCARFVGATTQALYIDSPAADPFNIKTGSFGAWVRTAAKGVSQQIISKWGAGQQAWCLYITSNVLELDYGFSAGAPAGGPIGVTILTDDRWHFVVGTFDGTCFRLYVDGALDTQLFVTGLLYSTGTGPFNIGSAGANAGTAAGTSFNGRIDEAFVSGEVLTDDQVRNLYCAKIPHTLGSVPTRASLSIRRRRRGATLVIGDFATQPLRLHNFTLGSLGDEGSNGIPVQNNGPAIVVAGPDGTPSGAFHFLGTASQSLYSNDTNLPNLLLPRSYGCWFKTPFTTTGFQGLVSWGGGTSISAGAVLSVFNGNIMCQTPSFPSITAQFVADALWHHAVVVEDNAALDGMKQKLYLDGRMIGAGSSLGSLALGGANRFRIGILPDSSGAFTGQIDSVYVCGYAQTAEEIYKIYAKGSQALAPSPKNVGDHVEAFTATDILATFDSLDSSHQVDLGVAA